LTITWLIVGMLDRDRLDDSPRSYQLAESSSQEYQDESPDHPAQNSRIVLGIDLTLSIHPSNQRIKSPKEGSNRDDQGYSGQDQGLLISGLATYHFAH
jgi:hypothetical protein